MDFPFILKCARKKPQLPKIEYSMRECPWYINSTVYKNCFWVMAEELLDEGVQLDNSVIAVLEGVSEDSIERIYQDGLKKFSVELEDFSEFPHNS